MRQKMMLRDDGMYGMLVDGNQCPILMGSLTGGYRYPEEEMPGENPEKDGYWDHSVDAARMVVVNLYGKPEPEKPGEKGVYIVSEMPIANRLQVDQGGPNIVRMVA
jgi:hypothetical protein